MNHAPTAPLVSVVTPSYNAARFIEETIASVQMQDYPQVEHVIVDGGSTDGTVEILKCCGESVRWISEPDRGQSDALNKGFTMARGQILCWLNADDRFAVDCAVSQAADVLIHCPEIGFVYANADIIDEFGRTVGRIEAPDFDYQHLVLENIIPGVTPFLRRAVVETCGGVRLDLHYVMDYDLWLRAGRAFGCRKLPAVLGDFRVCSGTKTFEHPDRFWVEQIGVHRKFFQNTPLSPGEVALEYRALARDHWQAGLAYHRKGSPNEGQEYCRAAISDFALLDADSEWGIRAFLHSTFHTGLDDREGFVRGVVENLPRSSQTRTLTRKATATYYISEMFVQRSLGNTRAARRCLAKSLLTDLGQARNLGVASAAAELVLGRATADGLRRVLRRVRSVPLATDTGDPPGGSTREKSTGV